MHRLLLCDGGWSDAMYHWKRVCKDFLLRFPDFYQMWVFHKVTEMSTDGSLKMVTKRALRVFVCFPHLRNMDVHDQFTSIVHGSLGFILAYHSLALE